MKTRIKEEKVTHQMIAGKNRATKNKIEDILKSKAPTSRIFLGEKSKGPKLESTSKAI